MIARRTLAAAAALGLLGAGLATSTAAAQTPSTQITVTPSTGLADGDAVEVQVSGYPPGVQLGTAMCDAAAPLSLADCDTATAVLTGVDSSGSATFSRSVARFIYTNEGPRDCAVESCWLAAAAVGAFEPDMSTVATAALSFEPTSAMDGLTVTVEPPAYLDEDPRGSVTILATLTCEESDLVHLQFRFWQTLPGGFLRGGTSNIEVPCTAGVPLAISSDLISSNNEAGPAKVMVRASMTTGVGSATLVQDSDVISNADAVAAFLARFADPSDTTAVADFVAALTFRVLYNPIFAQEFWAAVSRRRSDGSGRIERTHHGGRAGTRGLAASHGGVDPRRPSA